MDVGDIVVDRYNIHRFSPRLLLIVDCKVTENENVVFSTSPLFSRSAYFTERYLRSYTEDELMSLGTYIKQFANKLCKQQVEKELKTIKENLNYEYSKY